MSGCRIAGLLKPMYSVFQGVPGAACETDWFVRVKAPRFEPLVKSFEVVAWLANDGFNTAKRLQNNMLQSEPLNFVLRTAPGFI